MAVSVPGPLKPYEVFCYLLLRNLSPRILRQILDSALCKYNGFFTIADQEAHLFSTHVYKDARFDFLLPWNEPGSVPKCLTGHLEIFEWEGYKGRREEKEAIRYIFANSKCLKRAGISVESTKKPKEKEKMIKELESMFRVSTPSQLFFSTQLEYLSSEMIRMTNLYHESNASLVKQYKQ